VRRADVNRYARELLVLLYSHSSSLDKAIICSSNQRRKTVKNVGSFVNGTTNEDTAIRGFSSTMPPGCVIEALKDTESTLATP
jgi:hypothetical protein